MTHALAQAPQPSRLNEGQRKHHAKTGSSEESTGSVQPSKEVHDGDNCGFVFLHGLLWL